MSTAHASSTRVSTGRRRSSRRSVAARSLQLLRWTFGLVAVGCALGLALLLPARGRPAVIVVEAVVALLAGASVARVVDRWNRGHVVDLRHHDLLEGLRHGVVPTDPFLESETGDRGNRPSSTRSVAPSTEHRLFGHCGCPACAAGLPEVADEAVAAQAPPSGRDITGRSVIDLRTRAARPARAALGRRSSPTV